MNASNERLILNLVACGCFVIAFVVMKYGFAEAYQCLREHVKKHISG